jgi:acyl-ACP thioesterase
VIYFIILQEKKGREVMYTYNIKVGYSVTDSTLTMTIPAILDCFEDAATYEAETGAVSMENLARLGIVWVLSSWQIVIERRPRLFENIKIYTAPYDFKGFLGYRNFWIEGENGEVIVKASSIWTLLNTANLRPTKPTEEVLEGYKLMEKLDMDYKPRKIAIKGNPIEGESFKIRKYQIDSNQHVNNVEYVKLAMETLPIDKEITGLRVEYKKSAHYGDTLKTLIYNGDTDTHQVVLEDENGDVTAIIEFM